MSAGKIDHSAEFEALRACTADVVNAKDGRGVRAARSRCYVALVNAGHTRDDAIHITDAQSKWSRKWSAWAIHAITTQAECRRLAAADGVTR